MEMKVLFFRADNILISLPEVIIVPLFTTYNQTNHKEERKACVGL